MLGQHVGFESNSLYCGVAAECTVVRLLAGVAHAMTPQRVVVTGRVSTNVTSVTVYTYTSSASANKTAANYFHLAYYRLFGYRI